MSEARKIKRVKFTLDILFDEFVDLKHVKELSEKIAETLKNESESGTGLGDGNALPIEIRVFNEETGVAIQRFKDASDLGNSFINVENKS